MPQSMDEWSDQYWDRALARQTAQVDAVKLVVTFSLAVAATLVASALQAPPSTDWDTAAAILLGLAFAATLVSVMLDRLKVPRRQAVLQKQQDETWSDIELLLYVQRLQRDLDEENEVVVRHVRRSAEYQLLLAVGAGALSIVSLLQ